MAVEFWTLDQVAEHFGLATSTVRRLVEAGVLPAPLKIGRSVRFRLRDIHEVEQRLLLNPAGRPQVACVRGSPY